MKHYRHQTSLCPWCFIALVIAFGKRKAKTTYPSAPARHVSGRAFCPIFLALHSAFTIFVPIMRIMREGA